MIDGVGEIGRWQVGQAGVQGRRGRYRERGGDGGDEPGLECRGGGELATAGAQGGSQCGLVGAYARGESAGEDECRRGQDTAEDGDGEHDGGGDVPLVVGGPQGQRQFGGDTCEPDAVAEGARQPAVGTADGRGHGLQVVAVAVGQVRMGGDLQPVDCGTGGDQVGEVDEERAVGVDRLLEAAVPVAGGGAGRGQRVAVPAAPGQRAYHTDDDHVDGRDGRVGQLGAEAYPVTGGEAEQLCGGLQQHRVAGVLWPAPGDQLASGRQVVQP
ncbi:hypothetical protein PSN01_01682 [Micromonospora saelicesensis]|nr:hypothetical protein PSN01_01682 [Micromonospora saelicesensis]